MFNRILISLVLLLILPACVQARFECTDPLGCMEVAAGEPILIGVLSTLHGPKAPAGNAILEGVQAAAVNTSLVLGHEVELAWVGTDCSEHEALLAATQLGVMEALLAVIGPSCPEDIPIAIPVLQDAGVAVIQPKDGGAAAYEAVIQAIQQVGVLGRDKHLFIPRTAFFEELGILP